MKYIGIGDANENIPLPIRLKNQKLPLKGLKNKIARWNIMQDIWIFWKQFRKLDSKSAAVSYTHLDVYKRQR